MPEETRWARRQRRARPVPAQRRREHLERVRGFVQRRRRREGARYRIEFRDAVTAEFARDVAPDRAFYDPLTYHDTYWRHGETWANTWNTWTPTTTYMANTVYMANNPCGELFFNGGTGTTFIQGNSLNGQAAVYQLPQRALVNWDFEGDDPDQWNWDAFIESAEQTMVLNSSPPHGWEHWTHSIRFDFIGSRGWRAELFMRPLSSSAQRGMTLGRPERPEGRILRTQHWDSRRRALINHNRNHAAHLRAKVARRKARTLLESYLSAAQREEFAEHHFFTVVGSEGGVFRIRSGHYAGNVDEMDGDRQVGYYCCHIDTGRFSAPIYDHLLAQMLMIVTDERHFRELGNFTRFTRVAQPIGRAERQQA